MSDSGRKSHFLCCCFRERQRVEKKQSFFMKMLKSLLTVQGALLELVQFMEEGECPEYSPSPDPEWHPEERDESERDEDSIFQDLMLNLHTISSLSSDSSKRSSEICSSDPNLKPSSDRQRNAFQTFRDRSPIQTKEISLSSSDSLSFSFSDSSSTSQESECKPNKDQTLPSGSPTVPDTNQPETKSDRFLQEVKINQPECKEESTDEDEMSDEKFLIDEELNQWLDEQIPNLVIEGKPNTMEMSPRDQVGKEDSLGHQT